jgi:hypothetical protein
MPRKRTRSEAFAAAEDIDLEGATNGAGSSDVDLDVDALPSVDGASSQGGIAPMPVDGPNHVDPEKAEEIWTALKEEYHESTLPATRTCPSLTRLGSHRAVPVALPAFFHACERARPEL